MTEMLDMEGLLFASECRNPNPMFGIAQVYGVRGFVYVIAPEGVEDVVKIGWTDSIPSRLVQLQCGAWNDLRLAAAVVVIDANPVKLEQAAHRIAKERSTHRRGEWFNLTEVDAVQIVVEAARRLRMNVTSLAKLAANDRVIAAERRTAAREAERVILRRKLGIDETNLVVHANR